MFRTREEILLPRRLTAFGLAIILTVYYSIPMKKERNSGFLPCFWVFLWNNAVFSEIRL
jgi:hypothetical protein